MEPVNSIPRIVPNPTAVKWPRNQNDKIVVIKTQIKSNIVFTYWTERLDHSQISLTKLSKGKTGNLHFRKRLAPIAI